MLESEEEESFDNTLVELFEVQQQIKKLENRRLSQRVEEVLSASPNLKASFSGGPKVASTLEKKAAPRRSGSNKRKAEEEVKNPKDRKMPTMDEKLDLIDKVETTQTEVIQRLRTLEEESAAAKARDRADRMKPGQRRRRNSSTASIQDQERQAYLEARRSLTISPVEAPEEQVKLFMANKLQMEREAIEDLLVQSMTKLHFNKRILIRGKPRQPTVKLVFNTNAGRDLVMSHTGNLPKDCALEPVVPDHLHPLRRHLESFAFKVRRNARERGTKTSTSIRFNSLQ